MKQFSFKALVPHLIAVGIFLVFALIIGKPALESDVVMQQSDFTSSEAMRHQSEQYKQEHGTYPIWITSMFSGMPAYNIAFEGPYSPLFFINDALKLWLPKPMNFFFLCCISFYFLALCLRLRPYVGILGALAFAYCSYNPILVAAGHDTKLFSLAYVPALLGGVITLFEGKYLQGFLLTLLFTSLHLLQNHQQISFYALLILIIMGFFYAVRWVIEKRFIHMAKVVSLSTLAGAIGLLSMAILIFPVADYAKDSKRGGQLLLNNTQRDDNTTVKGDSKTTGLSRDYAFQWSYGRSESLSLLFPGITGYGTYFTQRDNEYHIFPQLGEKSNVVDYFTNKLNVPEDQAINFASNLSGDIYWGDKSFTSGSVYLGAAVCFLFVLGLFLLDGKHKWWILTASIFGIILAMGKNMPFINNFLFDHLPLYNKFRTPEMALVIPQVLFPVMAVLTVDKLLDSDKIKAFQQLRFSAIAMAAIFVLAGLFYLSFDYSKENKERTRAITEAIAKQDSTTSTKLAQINQQMQPQTDNKVFENMLQQTKGDAKVAREVVSALRKDRQGFYGSDILRSLFIVVLTVLLIGLFLKDKLNGNILILGLGLLIGVDLLSFGLNYISEKSFESADKYQANEFPMSNADKIILADKDPNFRVFNAAGGDPFQDAKTSYYHKSVGGYHPAKMGIYDDLITYQLSGQPNFGVLNMLNVKYVIQRNEKGDNTVPYPNMQALGNCWFVNAVKFEKTPADVMRALTNFSPADTAIAEEADQKLLTGFVAADSSSSIKQTQFENMVIEYQSNGSGNHLAVFSEVYHRDWHAYIDGKEVPVSKVNYVLRALVVPSGKHTIQFKFEPKVYNTSYTITKIFGWLVLAILLAGVALLYFQQKKETVAA